MKWINAAKGFLMLYLLAGLIVIAWMVVTKAIDVSTGIGAILSFFTTIGGIIGVVREIMALGKPKRKKPAANE